MTNEEALEKQIAMTFEELKAEAEKQGYALLKKKPYIPHVKCSCGHRGSLWHTFKNGKSQCRVECGACGNKADWADNEYDAWKDWYLRSTPNVR